MKNRVGGEREEEHYIAKIMPSSLKDHGIFL